MTKQNNRQIYVGLDVEGVLVLPKADYAWLLYDFFSSKEIKALFPRQRCEAYDSKYDDGRYLHELKNPEGHATGTWPCVSAALASLSGMNDLLMFKYAEETTQEMPDTKEFLEHAKKVTDGRVYFFTSSYPAVALIIADKYGIPSSHVFTMGRQLDAERLRYCEEKRKSVDMDKARLPPMHHDQIPMGQEIAYKNFSVHRSTVLKAETEMRSPINVFRRYPTMLGIFMSEYFKVTEKISDWFEKGPTGFSYDKLIEQHDELFELIPPELQDLRKDLENCFLSPKSRGNMGSRNKTLAMQSIHNDGNNWFYSGDGIVDGNPLGFASYGISINMRDKHALPYSKISMATTKVSDLIPALDQALEGRFDAEELKQKLNSTDTQVFSHNDIMTHLDDVRKAAGNAKKKLGDLWVPVKS